VVVTRDVAKDPAQTALISQYATLVQPISSKVIGQVAGGVTLPKPVTDVETSLGRLVADAQKNDPSVAGGAKKPQIAFMNPGGLRGDLVPAANGDVSFGAAFAVQPFNNNVVAMDLTGQQVYDVLEQQFSGDNATSPRILQVSEGFTYSYSAAATAGSKIVADSVKLDGAAIDKAATYRVVANSFLSDGGDNFLTFVDGKDKLVGGLDINSFGTYLTAKSPYTPIETDRITAVP
jgi:5'-nucleotidase